MDLLVNTVQKFIAACGSPTPHLIAFSGGLDSHVLLHLFAASRLLHPIQLRAVYINHGVSPHAEQWALHCADICKNLNIDFTKYHIVNKNISSSPEVSLRQLRYEQFTQLLAPKDILLTAHHQEDQAETVLLQLLRGAGPKGLAAMPSLKTLGNGLHGRPLLSLTRADLRQYAIHHELCWIEDESNTNTNYTRNFLRHEVLPILTKRWPRVAKTLARVADNCAQSQQVLDSVIQPDLALIQGKKPHTLSIKKLQQFDLNKQIHLLRAWLLQCNFSLPSAKKMQQLVKDVLEARCDKMPYLAWRDVEIRRYRDDLFCLPVSAKRNSHQKMIWNLSESLSLQNGMLLQAKSIKGSGLRADISEVTLHFRIGGETIQLPGRTHHHDLKKLFQTWGVPPWQRDQIPLAYVNDQLAAVVGFCVADQFVARGDECGWSLSTDPKTIT